MANYLTELPRSALNSPYIARTRRNHGLEHATLQILSQRYPRKNMAGHSNTRGFWLVGDVPTEAVQNAVTEALERVKAGERSLVVHPNCGTNFVTSGTMAGLAAFIGLFGAGRRFRDKLERLPFVVTLATLALILSQPLGRLLQEKVTTSADLEDLVVVKIIPAHRGRTKIHRILTSS